MRKLTYIIRAIIKTWESIEMHNLSKILLAACLVFATASVFAHDEPEEEPGVDPWDGTGEAGFVLKQPVIQIQQR